MKKFLLSSFVIVVFIGYALHDRLEGLGHENIAPLVSPTSSAPTQTATPTLATAVPLSSPTNLHQTPGPTAQPQGMYKDGSYVSDVVDAFYGNVQVKAVISGGKISDVQFLQYPNDRSTSREISAQAMPMLTAEAIAKQDANVDIVSGATSTSEGFIKALGTALSQAKI